MRGKRTPNAVSDAVRKKIFLMIYDENLPVKEIVRLHKGVRAAPQRTALYDMARQFESCGEWRRFAYLAWVSEQNGAGQLVGSLDERVQAPAHASRARRCDALPVPHVAAIGALLEEKPELYLEELQTELLGKGITAGIDAISRAIHTPVHEGGLGLSLKKLERRASQRSFRDRLRFLRRVRTGDIRPQQVICIDETHKSRQV